MHAVAIRLRDRGFDDGVIGIALDLDDEHVPGLLRLAEAKLANLMAPEGVPSARRIQIAHSET